MWCGNGRKSHNRQKGAIEIFEKLSSSDVVDDDWRKMLVHFGLALGSDTPDIVTGTVMARTCLMVLRECGFSSVCWEYRSDITDRTWELPAGT